MTIYLKECPICGKRFKAKRRDAIYCSSYCKNKKRYMNKEPRICQWCGKEFIPRHGHQKYCDKECYRLKQYIINATNIRKRRIENKDFYDAKQLGSLKTNLKEEPIKDKNGEIDFEKEYKAIKRQKQLLGLK